MSSHDRLPLGYAYNVVPELPAVPRQYRHASYDAYLPHSEEKLSTVKSVFLCMCDYTAVMFEKEIEKRHKILRGVEYVKSVFIRFY